MDTFARLRLIPDEFTASPREKPIAGSSFVTALNGIVTNAPKQHGDR